MDRWLESQRQFDRRHLTLAPLMDGMTSLTGLLDAESAALLDAALQPFLVPGGAHDTRTTAQRRADGLTQIVQTACDHSLFADERGSAPAPEHPSRPSSTGLGTHDGGVCRCCPSPVVSPGRLLGNPGTPGFLHPLSVARVACDAQVTALLLDSEGVVVNLGRTQRLFSASQRRLLALRDGGCRYPGCDRPPAHTDAHHVRSWQAGGSTDIPNAILLCRHHHRAVHEGGWSITIQDPARGASGPVLFDHPAGHHHPSHPRGP